MLMIMPYSLTTPCVDSCEYSCDCPNIPQYTIAGHLRLIVAYRGHSSVYGSSACYQMPFQLYCVVIDGPLPDQLYFNVIDNPCVGSTLFQPDIQSLNSPIWVWNLSHFEGGFDQMLSLKQKFYLTIIRVV
jgi:hypothetical protein